MTLRLALFDLDNTLLGGDSDFEWAQFLIEQGVFDREVYEARNQEFYDHYRAGVLDIHAFLDFQLQPLSRHPRRQLEQWREHFMEEKIRPIILPKGRELIVRHAAEADLLAIITATNDFVTTPIAHEIGVNHLIATEAECRDGEFTGGVVGTPCFREGKIACLEYWLESLGYSWQDIGESWFYSDSLNDLPLLERVTYPTAVDPDATLRAYAENYGWPVISLR